MRRRVLGIDRERSLEEALRLREVPISLGALGVAAFVLRALEQRLAELVEQLVVAG